MSRRLSLHGEPGYAHWMDIPATASGRRALITPGLALRALRLDKGWTLQYVSKQTGIPVSTLSKIETGKSELTMDRLLRVSTALEVNIADFFGTPPENPIAGDRGRRSITRSGEGKTVVSPYGAFTHHAQDLLEKHVSPIVANITATSLEEFGEFHRHTGEEYLLVLSGELMLYTDIYAPTLLKTDDSIYFDSGMGHAYVASGAAPCRILIICAPPGNGVVRMFAGDVAEWDASITRSFEAARAE